MDTDSRKDKQNESQLDTPMPMGSISLWQRHRIVLKITALITAFIFIFTQSDLVWAVDYFSKWKDSRKKQAFLGPKTALQISPKPYIRDTQFSPKGHIFNDPKEILPREKGKEKKSAPQSTLKPPTGSKPQTAKFATSGKTQKGFKDKDGNIYRKKDGKLRPYQGTFTDTNGNQQVIENFQIIRATFGDRVYTVKDGEGTPLTDEEANVPTEEAIFTGEEGRIDSITYTNGTIDNYSYEGDTTIIKKGDDTYYYDKEGELKKIVKADGTVIDDPSQLRPPSLIEEGDMPEYDIDGNLIKVTKRDGTQISLQDNRITKLISPEGTTTYYREDGLVNKVVTEKVTYSYSYNLSAEGEVVNTFVKWTKPGKVFPADVYLTWERSLQTQPQTIIQKLDAEGNTVATYQKKKVIALDGYSYVTTDAILVFDGNGNYQETYVRRTQITYVGHSCSPVRSKVWRSDAGELISPSILEEISTAGSKDIGPGVGMSREKQEEEELKIAWITYTNGQVVYYKEIGEEAVIDRIVTAEGEISRYYYQAGTTELDYMEREGNIYRLNEEDELVLYSGTFTDEEGNVYIIDNFETIEIQKTDKQTGIKNIYRLNEDGEMSPYQGTFVQENGDHYIIEEFQLVQVVYTDGRTAYYKTIEGEAVVDRMEESNGEITYYYYQPGTTELDYMEREGNIYKLNEEGELTLYQGEFIDEEGNVYIIDNFETIEIQKTDKQTGIKNIYRLNEDGKMSPYQGTFVQENGDHYIIEEFQLVQVVYTDGRTAYYKTIEGEAVVDRMEESNGEITYYYYQPGTTELDYMEREGSIYRLNEKGELALYSGTFTDEEGDQYIIKDFRTIEIRKSNGNIYKLNEEGKLVPYSGTFLNTQGEEVILENGEVKDVRNVTGAKTENIGAEVSNLPIAQKAINNVKEFLNRFVNASSKQQKILLSTLGLDDGINIAWAAPNIEKIAVWLKEKGILVINCATNSLTTLLNFLGTKVLKEEIATSTILIDTLLGILEPGAAGPISTSLYAMLKAAASKGIQLYAVQTTFEQLKNIEEPVIAHVKIKSGEGHYVVVTEANDNEVIVIDNGIEVKLSQEEFTSQWRGYILSTRAPPGGTLISDEEMKKVLGAPLGGMVQQKIEARRAAEPSSVFPAPAPSTPQVSPAPSTPRASSFDFTSKRYSPSSLPAAVYSRQAPARNTISPAPSASFTFLSSFVKPAITEIQRAPAKSVSTWLPSPFVEGSPALSTPKASPVDFTSNIDFSPKPYSRSDIYSRDNIVSSSSDWSNYLISSDDGSSIDRSWMSPAPSTPQVSTSTVKSYSTYSSPTSSTPQAAPVDFSPKPYFSSKIYSRDNVVSSSSDWSNYLVSADDEDSIDRSWMSPVSSTPQVLAASSVVVLDKGAKPSDVDFSPKPYFSSKIYSKDNVVSSSSDWSNYLVSSEDGSSIDRSWKFPASSVVVLDVRRASEVTDPQASAFDFISKKYFSSAIYSRDNIVSSSSDWNNYVVDDGSSIDRSWMFPASSTDQKGNFVPDITQENENAFVPYQKEITDSVNMYLVGYGSDLEFYGEEDGNKAGLLQSRTDRKDFTYTYEYEFAADGTTLLRSSETNSLDGWTEYSYYDKETSDLIAETFGEEPISHDEAVERHEKFEYGQYLLEEYMVPIWHDNDLQKLEELNELAKTDPIAEELFSSLYYLNDEADGVKQWGAAKKRDDEKYANGNLSKENWYRAKKDYDDAISQFSLEAKDEYFRAEQKLSDEWDPLRFHRMHSGQLRKISNTSNKPGVQDIGDHLYVKEIAFETPQSEEDMTDSSPFRARNQLQRHLENVEAAETGTPLKGGGTTYTVYTPGKALPSYVTPSTPEAVEALKVAGYDVSGYDGTETYTAYTPGNDYFVAVHNPSTITSHGNSAGSDSSNNYGGYLSNPLTSYYNVVTRTALNSAVGNFGSEDTGSYGSDFATAESIPYGDSDDDSSGSDNSRGFWGGVTNWVDKNVIQPVIEGIQGGADWANENIVQPVTEVVQGGADWANDNVVQPVTEVVQGGADWANDNVVQPVTEVVQGGADWANDNVVQPVTEVVQGGSNRVNDGLNGVKNAGNAAVNFLTNPVETIQSGLNIIGNAVGLGLDLAGNLDKALSPQVSPDEIVSLNLAPTDLFFDLAGRISDFFGGLFGWGKTDAVAAQKQDIEDEAVSSILDRHSNSAWFDYMGSVLDHWSSHDHREFFEYKDYRTGEYFYISAEERQRQLGLVSSENRWIFWDDSYSLKFKKTEELEAFLFQYESKKEKIEYPDRVEKYAGDKRGDDSRETDKPMRIVWRHKETGEELLFYPELLACHERLTALEPGQEQTPWENDFAKKTEIMESLKSDCWKAIESNVQGMRLYPKYLGEIDFGDPEDRKYGKNYVEIKDSFYIKPSQWTENKTKIREVLNMDIEERGVFLSGYEGRMENEFPADELISMGRVENKKSARMVYRNSEGKELLFYPELVEYHNKLVSEIDEEQRGLVEEKIINETVVIIPSSSVKSNVPHYSDDLTMTLHYDKNSGISTRYVMQPDGSVTVTEDQSVESRNRGERGALGINLRTKNPLQAEINVTKCVDRIDALLAGEENILSDVEEKAFKSPVISIFDIAAVEITTLAKKDISMAEEVIVAFLERNCPAGADSGYTSEEMNTLPFGGESIYAHAKKGFTNVAAEEIVNKAQNQDNKVENVLKEFFSLLESQGELINIPKSPHVDGVVVIEEGTVIPDEEIIKGPEGIQIPWYCSSLTEKEQSNYRHALYLQKEAQGNKDTPPMTYLKRVPAFIDTFEEIVFFASNEIGYVKDEQDAYQPPGITFRSGVGDCEDISGLTDFLLEKAGIPSKMVGFVADVGTDRGYGHWVVVYRDLSTQGWKVMDHGRIFGPGGGYTTVEGAAKAFCDYEGVTTIDGLIVYPSWREVESGIPHNYPILPEPVTVGIP